MFSKFFGCVSARLSLRITPHIRHRKRSECRSAEPRCRVSLNTFPLWVWWGAQAGVGGGEHHSGDEHRPAARAALAELDHQLATAHQHRPRRPPAQTRRGHRRCRAQRRQRCAAAGAAARLPSALVLLHVSAGALALGLRGVRLRLLHRIRNPPRELSGPSSRGSLPPSSCTSQPSQARPHSVVAAQLRASRLRALPRLRSRPLHAHTLSDQCLVLATGVRRACDWDPRAGGGRALLEQRRVCRPGIEQLQGHPVLAVSLAVCPCHLTSRSGLTQMHGADNVAAGRGGVGNTTGGSFLDNHNWVEYWDDVEEKWETANDPGTSVSHLCDGVGGPHGCGWCANSCLHSLAACCFCVRRGAVAVAAAAALRHRLCVLRVLSRMLRAQGQGEGRVQRQPRGVAGDARPRDRRCHMGARGRPRRAQSASRALKP